MMKCYVIIVIIHNLLVFVDHIGGRNVFHKEFTNTKYNNTSLIKCIMFAFSISSRQMLAYGRRVPLEEFEYRIDVSFLMLDFS